MLLVLLMAISGQASALTQAEVDSADYGRAITQKEAEDCAVEFLRAYYKHSALTKSEWKPVFKGVLRDVGVAGGGKSWFGYILIGSVTAKNLSGGYTGAKPFSFVFNNGIITSAYTGTENNPMMKIQ